MEIKLLKDHKDIRGFYFYAERKAGSIYPVLRVLAKDCVECFDAENNIEFIQLGDFEFVRENNSFYGGSHVAGSLDDCHGDN